MSRINRNIFFYNITLFAILISNPFAQNTSTDNFERATLGNNWFISFPPTGNQVQIIGNSDLGMVAGPQGFFLANWIGRTFTADQYCEAIISPDAPTDWAFQVYVRRRSSDAARYGFHFDNDPNQPEYFNKWCFKYDGVPGPETRVFAMANGNQAPKPGDTLRVEIRGYTLYGYHNGRLVLTATDTASNRIANGVPGMAARLAIGNQAINQSVKVWESWTGGDLITTSVVHFWDRQTIQLSTSVSDIIYDLKGRTLRPTNSHYLGLFISNSKRNK